MRFRERRQERRRLERVKQEVHELEDEELVESAFDQFWETFAPQDDIDPRARADMMDGLREAQDQLLNRVTLTKMGRSRLRSFLINERLRVGE
jgi:hypothetical protein